MERIGFKDIRDSVITLIGSRKFTDDFSRLNISLSLQNNIVFCPYFTKATLNCISDEQKLILDKLNLQKIIRSDIVFVVNVGGYIGEATNKEIEFAMEHKKKIIYYSAIDKPKLNAPWDIISSLYFEKFDEDRIKDLVDKASMYGLSPTFMAFAMSSSKDVNNVDYRLAIIKELEQYTITKNTSSLFNIANYCSLEYEKLECGGKR